MKELKEAKKDLDQTRQRLKDAEQSMVGMKSEVDVHRLHAM